MAGVKTLNGGSDEAPLVLRASAPPERLPPVVVVDRSAFNRNCIVASLKSHDVFDLSAFDRVADVPATIGDPAILFVIGSGDADVDQLDRELQAARDRWPAGIRVLLIGDRDAGLPDLSPARLGLLNAILADDLPTDLLVAALRLAHRRHVVVPRRVLPGMFERAVVDGSTLDRIAADHPLLVRSTARQRQVMQLLVIGLSNKAIAKRLLISESTVKAHIRAIMDMLGAENRTQIVARVMRLHEDAAGDRADEENGA